MKGRTNNPKGRPRVFNERETISLALPRELVVWADAVAKHADMSRTRLLTELISLARSMVAFDFVRVNAKGATFRQVPNPEIGRDWLKPEYQALAGGVTISSDHGELERLGTPKGFAVDGQNPWAFSAETGEARAA